MWREYHTPVSVAETLKLLTRFGTGARIIAGGTDLLVELRRAARPDLLLIDVSRMGGLDSVCVDGVGLIHFGPGVTHNQAASSRLLCERAAPLAMACSQVGTPQIRNRGTIAGNLVTASPANDTITALWALDARLMLSSIRGTRSLAFSDFYQGVRRTVLEPDEMVTEVAFPALRADQRGTFLRLGLRRANTIAMVNAAVVLSFSDGVVADARIALGSVNPTIVRAREAEESLRGRKLNSESIGEAAGLAVRAASPINDVRAGAEYRSASVSVLVARALSSLRNGGRESTQAALPMLWGKTDGRFQGWTGAMLCHSDGGTEPIECTVNGNRIAVCGAGGKRLIDMLRDDLGLTGTKEGCGEGECGACTVWMDGIGVLACLVPAPRAHGTSIVTVEGMARGEALHPLQQAFIDEGAVQCGYCTPGFIMAGASLLDEVPRPTCEQIIAGLSGNLCRCTGYYTIIRAMERAMEQRGAR